MREIDGCSPCRAGSCSNDPPQTSHSGCDQRYSITAFPPTHNYSYKSIALKLHLAGPKLLRRYIWLKYVGFIVCFPMFSLQPHIQPCGRASFRPGAYHQIAASFFLLQIHFSQKCTPKGNLHVSSDVPSWILNLWWHKWNRRLPHMNSTKISVFFQDLISSISFETVKTSYESLTKLPEHWKYPHDTVSWY